MKRLHPSDHEEVMPKKFLRKSLVEEEEENRKTDEGGTEEGYSRGVEVLKGLTESEQNSVAGEDSVSAAIGNQNYQILGDGKNKSVQGRTPLRSAGKAHGMGNGVTDTPNMDDPRNSRRSRRASGSQAIILRSRRFSGDPSTAGTANVSQRQRRFSVGESEMLKACIDKSSKGGIRSRRSLGDPVQAPELVQGSKTSQKPVGRPPKVTRSICDEKHNSLASRLKRSHGLKFQGNPGKEKEAEDMRNNNALKVEESQFTCKVCGKNFEFLRGLNVHIVKMHKLADQQKQDGVDQCAICGKEFTKMSMLVEHSADPKAHKRPYACSLPHCSRTFSQMEHLLNHKSKVHEDSRVDQCQNCHLQFSSPGALAFHSNLKYCRPPKQKSYLTSRTPSTCTAMFSNRELLQLHLKLRHQEDPPDLSSFVTLQETPEEINFKCSVPGCLEKFSDTHKLQKHEDYCRKQKQATCRNCRKEFETPLDMLLHRISCEQKADVGTRSNIHLSCPNCSRKFKGDRFLQNHMKSSGCKEAFKTFICDASNCGKIFEKPVLLRNHLYSHTDAPFHCSRYPSF